MSARRTERLLNLVIALLSTRRWLTKEQVRLAVPQYDQCATTDAFDRMFERDKEELRELGIPLVSGTTSAWFDDEIGYRIDREAYALPDVDFTAGELAMLSLASRVWAQASLAGPAARALVKLRAMGVEPDEDSLIGLEPRVRTAEPAFAAAYAAARDRAPVTFRYRAVERSDDAVTGRARGGTPPALTRRHVQPWQVTSWRGRWYLVGHDTDRGATRVFRLSRIEGALTRTAAGDSYEVPADLDGRALVSRLVTPVDTTARTAHLRLRPGAAQQLRLRAASRPVSGPGSTASGSAADDVELTFTDVEELAATVAAAGADALVLAPPDLRDAVLRRLRGAADAHDPTRKPRRARSRRRPGPPGPPDPRSGAGGRAAS